MYQTLVAHLKLLKNTFPVSAPYELQHLLLPILLSDIVLSMMVITHPVCGYAAYKIAGRKRRLVIVIVPLPVMFLCTHLMCLYYSKILAYFTSKTIYMNKYASYDAYKLLY